MAAENPTRRWWASIGAGVALCVGCCLVPVLIAAGVLGGGTLLVSLPWLEPLGFALIGLGAAGLGYSRWRARRRGCTSTDSADGSCASTGCGYTTTSAGAAESGI